MPELPSDVDLYTIQVKNTSEVTMFILVGFLGDFEVQLFLFLLFLNLSFHSGRKFGTDCVGYWGFPAPQPYVLFSECVIILGCLLLFSCHPKNVDQFPVREQNYFLPWMCSTDVF